MNEVTYGPLLTDEALFAALDDSIPECARCAELFSQGLVHEAKRELLEYLRRALDRDTYLGAIRLDPTAPDELTKKQAEDAMNYDMVICNS